MSSLVRNKKVKRFKKDFNNLFLDAEKGSPLLKAKHSERRDNWILYGIYIVAAISVLLVIYFFNVYNQFFGVFIFLLIVSAIYYALQVFFIKIYQKKWVMENKLYYEKLVDFFFKMKQIGLKLIVDAESEENAGEKHYLLNRTLKGLSPHSQKPNSAGLKNNHGFLRFIPQKNQNQQKHLYYIQLSSGFKNESLSQTKEQDLYTKLLQTAEIIENDLYDKIHHYEIGSFIIIILTITITIPVGILFHLWGLLPFLSGSIIFLIIDRLQFPKSKIYIRALIVQGKLPINKIKLAVDHDALVIYRKIRLGNKIKQKQKKHSFWNKTQLKGIKKFYRYIIITLIVIGFFIIAFLTVYFMTYIYRTTI